MSALKNNWAEIGALIEQCLARGHNVTVGETRPHKRHEGRFYAAAGNDYMPPAPEWVYNDDPKAALAESCKRVLAWRRDSESSK